MKIPENLNEALNKRKASGLFRSLKTNNTHIDFSSNDYLGFAKNKTIHDVSNIETLLNLNGSTGSRLISGNNHIVEETENFIADYFNVESALIFNSGYDANIGLISCVTNKNDLVLYDELSHASIIDGLKLSYAKHYKFKHNSISHLEELILAHKNKHQNIYVITESVFSMDGDEAPLIEISNLCEKQNCFLIVDEAHGIGVFGVNGSGLCNELGIEKKCFARVITFGKAIGCHGAAVIGSQILRDYLINFARSFIYTTALPAESFYRIKNAFTELKSSSAPSLLKEKILFFKKLVPKNCSLMPSNSAVQCVLIPGNEKVQQASNYLIQQGLDVRAIKNPTVKEGSERLRICIHSFNTNEDVEQLTNSLKNPINSI